MSAVEALTEVLVPHSFNARYTVNTDGSWTWKCSCGHEYRYGVEIADQEVEHLAAALVAAIRSMPAEQVAEVVDGEVGYWTFYSSGAPYAEIRRQGDYSPERIAAQHVKEGQPVRRRVQGPWLPLGVSPETNGEQK